MISGFDVMPVRPDENDIVFMKEALREARKGIGFTSPNPMVGAVIVRDGMILSRGYHKRAGEPHAEVDALSKVEGRAKGSTLYVNLEPCNHHGRTPPCTEAILAAGLKRVVVGMRDPNPDVKGKGCEYLESRGVEVTEGVLGDEARELNEVFIKYSLTRRPFVILKSALTLDGWTASSTGHARWVTNERSRSYVHKLRAMVDGVLVGVGTVIADDPMLTVRTEGRSNKNPVRIIADSSLRTSLASKIVMDLSKARTIIAVGSGVDEKKVEKLKAHGVEILICPLRGGRIDLPALMDLLGGISVTSLLVEGGAQIAGSFLREGLVDKLCVFLAPKLLGGGDGIPMAEGPGAQNMGECINLSKVKVKKMAGDIMITGYPDYRGTRCSLLHADCKGTFDPADGEN